MDQVDALIHNPADIAAEYVAWAESLHANPGIPFGVPTMDKKIIPLRPGNLVGVIGRPGHGKTSLLAFLAVSEAQRIVQRQKADKECVLFCTWESAAEEIETFFMSYGRWSATDMAWGRVALDEVRRAAVKRAGLPIWIIGHGLMRAGQRAPRMYTETVLEAIRRIGDGKLSVDGRKPTLMLFDYLQRIPVKDIQEKAVRVHELPRLIKELAIAVACPAIVGIQAGRQVDERQIKLPEMADCQWASEAEQDADKLLSLWMPIRTEERGKRIGLSDGGHIYEVNDNLLFIRLLKQRGDQGRWTFAMHFEPEYLRLNALEIELDAPLKE